MNKEIRSLRGILLHLALLAVFGVFLPWKKGIEFLDPVMLSAYACLGVLFAAPTAAQTFAAKRPESMKAAIAGILGAVLYGECIVIAFLAAGIATVYFTRTVFFPPDLFGLALAAALGLTGSLAFASLAAYITMRFSATAARAALRIMFLGLLFLFFFRSQWLPDVAGTGALLALAIALVAMLGIRNQL